MKNKKRKVLLIGIVIILILLSIYFLLFSNKNGIAFKEKYLTIQYGDEFSFEKSIDSTSPKNLKIQYPNVELKEVGTYDLTFKYKSNNSVKEQKQTFVVEDTTVPTYVLKLDTDEILEVAQNSTLNPLINIDKIENLSSDAFSNPIKVTDDEYKKNIKEIKKAYKNINSRVIKDDGKIKKIETKNNYIFYKTNIDLTKIGTYEIKLCAVDENYNYSEIKQKIKVVEAGNLLNTGGKVVCDFRDNLPESDAYDTTYQEIYTYDNYKIVSSAQFITTMTFDNDYDTTDNMNTLLSAIKDKYNAYGDNAGVNVNIETGDGYIKVTITVDFNNYDFTKDPISILNNKSGSRIKIESVIKNITNGSCVIQ